LRDRPATVAAYYDANALPFALWERATGPLPVHRAIRAPGVRSRRGALAYVHRRVATEAGTLGAASVLDLGCGHGALLHDLRARLPHLSLAGVTLSRRQARIAASWLGSRPGSPEARVLVASYLDPAACPPQPAPRLLVAIESFVHSPGCDAFAKATAACASAGDRLVVCDDFLAGSGPGGGARRIVEAFREGWRAPGACTVDAFVTAAGREGWDLARHEDWTAFVPAGPPAALCSMALRLPRRLRALPLAGNLVGGAALVAGYRLGLFRYLYLVFERRRS
jgi:hypothetical protein